MTAAKKKADELVEKFKKFMYPFHDEVAKRQSIKCALIAVEEILGSAPGIPGDDDNWAIIGADQSMAKKFWQEVKQELINQQ
jgi:hypothetical protein